MKCSFKQGVVGLTIVVFIMVSLVTPIAAQPGRHYHYHSPPRHYHGPSSFDKTMGIMGAVSSIVAAANGHSPYVHHRQVVVVAAQPPTTVIVEKQPTLVVEKPVVVEREVVVEKIVPMPVAPPLTSTHYYSPQLGATFTIQNMQIPGYRFRAARLMSDPLEGSPLADIGLVKGDVVTRLSNDQVTSLEVLEKHQGQIPVRYIKAGTIKVQMARINIPTDREIFPEEDEVYFTP